VPDVRVEGFRRWVARLAAVVAAVVLGAGLLAPSASAAQGPDLNGVWWDSSDLYDLVITSGTSTAVSGKFCDAAGTNPCQYVVGPISGNIVDGAGELVETTTGTCGGGCLIPGGGGVGSTSKLYVTSVDPFEMTGFDVYSGPTPSPLNQATCSADPDCVGFFFGDHVSVATYTVSGHVYGQHCTSTCSLSGLADQKILVQGTASDGTTVNESSVTDASGAWSVMVPSGRYVAGSTLNGSTIDPTGYDPGSQPVTVGSGPVSDVDFTTCATGEGTSANLLFAPAGRTPWLRSQAVPSPRPIECIATYSFAVSANVPQPTFVDPSPNAPHAVSPDGTGYPANNDALGNEWRHTLPDCKDFSGRTYETTPLEWLSYYSGNTSLGSATIDLQYHSGLTYGTTLSKVSYVAGSLTRVFEWKRDDGKTGRCDSPRPVLPEVATKINGNSFTIVVSWSIPFTPRGVPVTETEVLQLKGVAKRVHMLADDALDEVPGFKEQNKVTKGVLTYALAETIEHTYGSAFSKLPSLKDAVSLGEDLLTYEKRLNLGLLVAQYGWDYAVAQFGAKLGYNPMVTVIRGQIRRIPCPEAGKPYKLCDLTQLAYDTTTARFPDYHLSVYRNGMLLPAAPDVPHRIHVAAGNQVQPIPNLNNSLEEFPGSKGGGLDERDLHDLGMGKLGPSAFDFASGAALFGPIPEELPGCNGSFGPTSTHTRCYTYGDGFA
jgi:hypothetical protein